MAEFPTYEEMAKNVAEKALDDFLYNGKSIREWMQIISSEDCISRTAIIKTLNEMDRYIANELTLCESDNKYPQNEVFIVDDVYEQIAEQLPSVTPKPKAGHWIKCMPADEEWCYQCSECNFWRYQKKVNLSRFKFCPNCGAKMKSE